MSARPSRRPATSAAGDVAGGAGGQRRVVALTVHAQEEEQDVGVRTAQSSTSTESMRCVLAANQRWLARKSLRRSRPLPFEEVHHRLGLRE